MSFVDRYAKERAEKDPDFKNTWQNPEEQMSFRLREELIALRLHLGLTQKQFAELVGVAQPLISRLENGSQNITTEKLQRILARTNTGARLKIELPDATPANFSNLLEEEMEVHHEALKGLVDR